MAGLGSRMMDRFSGQRCWPDFQMGLIVMGSGILMVWHPFLYCAYSVVALLPVQNCTKPAYIDSWCLAAAYSLSEEPRKHCKERHSFVI